MKTYLIDGFKGEKQKKTQNMKREEAGEWDKIRDVIGNLRCKQKRTVNNEIKD